MRLSDAGLRRRQTKLLDPHPRPPCNFTEVAPRDRSIRLLDATQRSRDRTHRSRFSLTFRSTARPALRCCEIVDLDRNVGRPVRMHPRLWTSLTQTEAILIRQRSLPQAKPLRPAPRYCFKLREGSPTQKILPTNLASNDEVERRGVAPTSNEAHLSRSSTLSLAHRRRDPAIARTDC